MTRRLVAASVVAALVSVSAHAAAHPEHYGQNASLVATRDRLRVELELAPGERVAAELAAKIDADGDHRLSGDEANRYAERVRDEVSLSVDGARATLNVDAVEVPSHEAMLTGQAVVRLVLSTGFTGTGEHRIVLRNDHAPVKSAHTLNVFSKDEQLVVSRVTRGDGSVAATLTGPPGQGRGWLTAVIGLGMVISLGLGRRRGQE